MSNLLYKLCADRHITLTPLRKEVLYILYQKKIPIRAYDLLAILKKTYPATEPPSVYRVLNFFIEKNLVHRIESQNAYVYCESWKDDQPAHKTILLLCKKCNKSTEFIDNDFHTHLSVFSNKNKIQIEDSLIEVKGICASCHIKKVPHS